MQMYMYGCRNLEAFYAHTVDLSYVQPLCNTCTVYMDFHGNQYGGDMGSQNTQTKNTFTLRESVHFFPTSMHTTISVQTQPKDNNGIHLTWSNATGDHGVEEMNTNQARD